MQMGPADAGSFCCLQYDRANRRVGFAPAPCQEIGQQELTACPRGTVMNDG